MGEKKVTTMVLKVDLQCSKCYLKVKKVLCQFPQIQEQIYDEKQNKVIIKVVCCSPEKIRDKIFCKGDGSIKSIEILPEKKHDETEENKSKNVKQSTGLGSERKQCNSKVLNQVRECCRECY